MAISYYMLGVLSISAFFFFNDTATTEIYTLSLHDALPISEICAEVIAEAETTHPDRSLIFEADPDMRGVWDGERLDRKSTRLNSSHLVISYAVFCLKKKKTTFLRQSSPTIQVTPPTFVQPS